MVSPSFPAVAEWPHRVENGVAYLRSLGFEVKIMPNAGLSTGWTAGTGEQRADDINQAFADPGVSVVLASIGGNHVLRTRARLGTGRASSGSPLHR
ncbi:MAG: LD-carboxypeptidase [Actinobacteria bacterium]|nr:LD-carboxypeptidase [Actinomycetota bacterium]